MLANEAKRNFLDRLTVICDTREQKNGHIKQVFDKYKIPYEDRKLDFGDYSFMVDGEDFSKICVIERKANVNELWGNCTTDRERFEKEMNAAKEIANSVTLLIEGISGYDELKAYKVSDYVMQTQGRKVQEIGERVYSTLRAWESGSRNKFKIIFMKDNSKTANEILETFYWYWHSYSELLKPLRKEKAKTKKAV